MILMGLQFLITGLMIFLYSFLGEPMGLTFGFKLTGGLKEAMFFGGLWLATLGSWMLKSGLPA